MWRVTQWGLLFSLLVLLMGVTPQPGRVLAVPGGQMRALWVTRFALTTPEKIDWLVRDAATHHFNTLFVQVRGRGEALYHSQLEPRSPLVKDPAFDPLAYTIAKAQGAGLDVHAWVNVYYVWSKEEAPPSPLHVVRVKPDWITRDVKGVSLLAMSQGGRMAAGSEGIFLDPALPAVRTYLVSLCREIWQTYDVDGIHLDYVRYPSLRFGYHPVSRKLFRQVYGVDPVTLVTDRGKPVQGGISASRSLGVWQQFRREQVDALVKQLAQTIEMEKPTLALSVAVHPDLSVAHKEKGQGWDHWLQAGWVDFVVPMVYHTDTRVVLKQVKAILSLSHSRAVVVGLGAWRQSPQEITQKIEQVEGIARRTRQYIGLSLFSYDRIGEEEGYLDYLSQHVFRDPVSPPYFAWKPSIDLVQYDF